jgi:DNA polymerase-3 subunit delta'
MRLIRIGESSEEANTVRRLIHGVGLAPAVAKRKVGLIVEADCFNGPSANAFLKTLEEPPADTSLILLSTRPHAILPTLRSRCLHFFVATEPPAPAPSVVAWCEAYQQWLSVLDGGLSGRSAAADPIIGAMALVARATQVIEQLAEDSLAAKPLPETISDEEADAITRGLEIAHRRRFLEAIARSTEAFAAQRLLTGTRDDARRKLVDSLAHLERVSRLLRYNLGDAAALENYLLSLLRVWVKPTAA